MLKEFHIFQEFPKECAWISLINLRHFGYNFGARNARRSLKTSKGPYYSLVSHKNLSQKMARRVVVQGLMTSLECK